MDAARYERIRELFLAADDLPAAEHESFVRQQAGDDETLVREVLELLGEHNPDAAKLEGSRSSHPAVPAPATLPEGSGSGEKVAGVAASQSTLRWAQRTHAQPRQIADIPQRPLSRIAKPKPRKVVKPQAAWYFLPLMLLPSAVCGYWARQLVIKNSVGTELAALTGFASNAAASVARFFEDEIAQCQEMISDSQVRESVLKLAELGTQALETPSPEFARTLRSSANARELAETLKQIAGDEVTDYIVFSRAGNVLATHANLESSIGSQVPLDLVEKLSRAMRGNNVVFGPSRFSLAPLRPAETPASKEDPRPEEETPLLQVMLPIRDANQRVAAAILFGRYHGAPKLESALAKSAAWGSRDYYLVGTDGMMMSESPHAQELVSTGRIVSRYSALATRMRVTDPGDQSVIQVADGRSLGKPLTSAAAGVVMGTSSHQISPYRNYAGEDVIGAWQPIPGYHLGVVVERSFDEVAAPASSIGWSFAGLGLTLGMLTVAATRYRDRTKKTVRSSDPLAKYEIGEPLGSGGMGIVFRAQHRHLGRPTALKVLRADRQEPDDALRFDREARVAASLQNKHIVTVYDYGQTAEGEYFTAMQLLEGLTLYEVVARSGPQPVGRVLFVLRQMCDAISAAHRVNLLHRDIKPQNIMLSLDPSVGDWVIVFDFGLAKPLSPDNDMFQTSEAIWSGTPMYMAPERFRDPKAADFRSDIYSMGCVAYFLLTGRPPFSECDPETLFALILSQTPIAISTHLSQPVDETVQEIVNRCLAKSADDRFENVEALANVIDELRPAYAWTAADAKKWWTSHG